MDKDVLSDLKEATKALADGELQGEESYKEMHKKLTSLLADIAQHIENVRMSLIDVKPSLVDNSSNLPSASGHLGDIDKTLADAADTLFTLTEKAIADNDRSEALLAALKESGAASSDTVDELMSINKATKSDLMEVFTALSFQDLAGQKIMKISTLIENVEKSILKILLVLGYSDKDDAEKSDEMFENLSADESPLQQNLVDDILKDFGL